MQSKPKGSYIWTACIDCGKERWTVTKAGNPQHLRCPSCANKIRAKSGENHPGWKGGRQIDGCGYIRVKLFSADFFFPMAYKSDYVLEHRLVMAKHLNRILEKDEVVHHLNGIKSDNRIVNLALATPNNHTTNTTAKLYQKRIRELEAIIAQRKLLT